MVRRYVETSKKNMMCCYCMVSMMDTAYQLCMEEEILTLVDANKEGALEKALVFYRYLNELPEDALLSPNYSHEKIKKGLKMIAESYGILNVIDLIYR